MDRVKNLKDDGLVTLVTITNPYVTFDNTGPNFIVDTADKLLRGEVRDYAI